MAGTRMVFPVAGHYTRGRTDRGIDFETKPGTPLVAMVDGTIVSDHGGFPGSLILKPDSGPIMGYAGIYYGHLQHSDMLVTHGHVHAGQVIARTSRSPVDAAEYPGHTEIGLGTISGGIDPIIGPNHLGRSGPIMQKLLTPLGLQNKEGGSGTGTLAVQEASFGIPGVGGTGAKIAGGLAAGAFLAMLIDPDFWQKPDHGGARLLKGSVGMVLVFAGARALVRGAV